MKGLLVIHLSVPCSEKTRHLLPKHLKPFWGGYVKQRGLEQKAPKSQAPTSLLPATSPHPQPTRKDSRGQCMSVRHTQSFLSAKGLQNPSLEGGLLATPIEAWWPKVMAGIM